MPEAVTSTSEEIPEQPDVPEPVQVHQQVDPPTQIEDPVQTSSLTYLCPRCHQSNTPDAEYCFACGMPLEESRSVSSSREEPIGKSEFVPAGFWVRVFAYVIDTVAITAIYFVLAFFYGGYLAATGDDLSDFGEQSFFVYAPLLVRAAYETILVANWATTVGKRLVGLYVIRADASALTLEGLGTEQSTPIRNSFQDSRSRVGLGRAFTRHLATYLSGLLLCIGYLQVAFRNDKLSLHDQISGTRVVRFNTRSTSR